MFPPSSPPKKKKKKNLHLKGQIKQYNYKKKTFSAEFPVLMVLYNLNAFTALVQGSIIISQGKYYVINV